MQTGKILVAQGGGPTAVINQSMVGIVMGSPFPADFRVYGPPRRSRHRQRKEFVDLTQETQGNLENVAKTASCPGLNQDKPDLA